MTPTPFDQDRDDLQVRERGWKCFACGGSARVQGNYRRARDSFTAHLRACPDLAVVRQEVA